VLAREETAGDKRLTAYVVAEGEAELLPGELRNYLREKLPEYMVPASYVQLPELPLTVNGKVDRQALPKPDQLRVQSDNGYALPQNGVEQIIAGVWQELLEVDRVGI